MNKMKTYLLPAVMIFLACTVTGKEKSRKSEAADTILLENIFPLQQQHCHGSSIVELPDGDLVCAWFQGSGERTSDDVAILGARYNHRSQKWSPPFRMARWVPEMAMGRIGLFVS